MSENRIYGEKIDINADNVREFYDKRAKKAADNPYLAVLLNDRSPELIREQMSIEKDTLFPKLKVDSDSRVLDIGCGIGRWADEVIPVCRSYYGVDFSQNMIDTAIERMTATGKDNYKFERMSFQELVDTEPSVKYNRVIISGVLMYICDDDIKMCLNKLVRMLDETCIIFIWDPCGVEQRLTLKDLPSEALNDKYNGIYRTKEEYDELYTAFTSKDFTVTFCDYYSKLGGTRTYSDTDRIYYILER